MSVPFVVLFGALYAVVCLVVTRAIAGHLAWKMKGSHDRIYWKTESPSIDQWIGAFLMGVTVGIAWPVVLPAAYLSRLMPVYGAERDERLKQQAKHIEQLEREAGYR